ncbi:ATP-binding protein [Streptomyces sp. WAC 06725]|uniref:ATP-binding protein n=1 Tax=Streptomyces sp. WAC 06725 TaxID=2203209 RepID=UPI000F743304|nr:ATP-binding protein [Streptomyces sp. WAC 06725]RSO23006.1 ATP-binding protein [Streptomyces sp. WAC 06725]
MDTRTASVTVTAAAFDKCPANAARARAATRAFLTSLDPAPGTDAIETAVLVVSELVTNALRHANGHCLLRLIAHRDTLGVAVTDRSPIPPHTRDHDAGEVTSGYGWPMVQHLALTTAVTPTAFGGKTVHAQLPQ